MGSGSVSIDDTARLLRVVSNPTRARIISLILAAPDARALVGELARELDLTQPTVSHHMKALAREGLLERVPEGRQVWYSINPADVDRITGLLEPVVDVDLTEAVLDRITRDLSSRFVGTFSRQTVSRYVRESHVLLSAASDSQRHLPSRTAQFAADRLEALARERETHSSETEVLFVCVQNSGRSQIAAAILRQLAGDRVKVRTAGSAPAGAVRAVVVSALDEIGVPVVGEFPKPLTDEVVRAADVVVTMGCGDACPVYPGRRYLDWELDDPAGQPIERVREIRDAIEARVRELLVMLGDRAE